MKGLAIKSLAKILKPFQVKPRSFENHGSALSKKATMSCHCMLGPVPDLHLKAGFRQFSASPSRNREAWWVTDSHQFTARRRKSTQCGSTCPSQVQVCIKGASKQRPRRHAVVCRQMQASRIVVMPMMQSRESQKTGLEYDEIELTVFDFCFYSLCHILFCCIQRFWICVSILNFP